MLRATTGDLILRKSHRSAKCGEYGGRIGLEEDWRGSEGGHAKGEKAVTGALETEGREHLGVGVDGQNIIDGKGGYEEGVQVMGKMWDSDFVTADEG